MISVTIKFEHFINSIYWFVEVCADRKKLSRVSSLFSFRLRK